jgi:hypothetical protein
MQLIFEIFRPADRRTLLIGGPEAGTPHFLGVRGTGQVS